MLPTLRDHRRLRLAVLCLLYLAQGLPYGFVTVALAGSLAAGGANAAAVGSVIAMAILPWSFKWAWGPLVDSGRFAALGRRRPWIMLAQAMMIVTGTAIAWLPGGNVAVLGWVVLVHNLFVGLQDVAVDALAVDLLEGRDRERASGMMYGTSYLGTFLGGAGLGIITARFGLGTAIAVLAAAQGVILGVVVAVRERSGDALLAGWRVPPAGGSAEAPARPGVIGIARALGRAMTSPTALRAAAAALLMKLLPAMLMVLMTVHLIDSLGWSQERFSTVTGGFGILLGLAASIAGGWLASWIGPRKTAIGANLSLAVVWIAFAFTAPFWDRSAPIFAWVAADTICQAVTTVALFAIFMRVASPAIAATQFTASMAIMNLATSLGSWLAGPIGRLIDVPTAFLIAGLLQPLAGLLLPRGDADHAVPSTPPGPADSLVPSLAPGDAS
jgi:PAT family beta-lactamase induction signal transducer AmpG